MYSLYKTQKIQIKEKFQNISMWNIPREQVNTSEYTSDQLSMLFKWAQGFYFLNILKEYICPCFI